MKRIEHLKPDMKTKKFEIIITVYENCQSTEINYYEQKTASYQEIIGAFEIQKAMYLYDQSLHNRKVLRRREREQKRQS